MKAESANPERSHIIFALPQKNLPSAATFRRPPNVAPLRIWVALSVQQKVPHVISIFLHFFHFTQPKFGFYIIEYENRYRSTFLEGEHFLIDVKKRARSSSVGSKKKIKNGQFMATLNSKFALKFYKQSVDTIAQQNQFLYARICLERRSDWANRTYSNISLNIRVLLLVILFYICSYRPKIKNSLQLFANSRADSSRHGVMK